MSNKAMSWATECGVTRSHKLILMLLADAHNGHTGECFPYQETLVDKSGYSLSTVQACLVDLEKWGLLKRETKRLGRGKGSRTHYILCLDILHPQILEVQVSGDTPPENGDLDPRPTGGQYKDKPEKEPERTGIDVGSVVDKIWIASPQPAKTRSSKKLVKAAIEKAIKIITAEQLVSAWQAFLRSSDAMKDGGKFVPAAHRWINDQKYEAWLPKEPDLLEQASGPTAEEQRRQDLDRCFEAFAKFGTWDGMRFGWTLKPTAEKADYPAELYGKYGVRRPGGVS